MTGETIPLTFACGPAQLVGLLHPAAQHLPRGVLIVVGAPQYRVGSHRQFVLLARELAGAGFPVLRFDYRGMGDSDGEFAGFEGIDDDIRSAVNTFFDRVPGLRDVVLWGLCDGASAAAFYGANDPRVSGLVIVNPWVRTEQTAARARLSGYYIQRLASRAFWARALGGKLDVMNSLRGLAGALAAAIGGGRQEPGRAGAAPNPVDTPANAGAGDLPARVGAALRRFKKPTLVILSGADLTAQEFREALVKAPRMRSWARRPGVQIKTLDGANHTYATEAWREQVHAWCMEWLRSY